MFFFPPKGNETAGVRRTCFLFVDFFVFWYLRISDDISIAVSVRLLLLRVEVEHLKMIIQFFTKKNALHLLWLRAAPTNAPKAPEQEPWPQMARGSWMIFAVVALLVTLASRFSEDFVGQLKRPTSPKVVRCAAGSKFDGLMMRHVF